MKKIVEKYIINNNINHSELSVFFVGNGLMVACLPSFYLRFTAEEHLVDLTTAMFTDTQIVYQFDYRKADSAWDF